MKYKLIACDLDGTLLNSEGRLSPENAKAISEIAEKGVLFVPATGRAFFESPEEIRNHPDVRFFISSNGAVIQDLKNGEKIEFPIDGLTVDKIHQKMKECKLLLAQHKNNYSIVDSSRLGDDVMNEYNISEKFRKQLRECTKPVDNIDEEFSRSEPCEMLSGCFKSKEQFDVFVQSIEGIKNIHCTGANSSIVEIISTSAGKQNAVSFLVNKLGLSLDDIITVGDSKNDIEMIELTKNSIAMKNAINILKDKAGFVGCSNNEHIAKYILEKFF